MLVRAVLPAYHRGDASGVTGDPELPWQQPLSFMFPTNPGHAATPCGVSLLAPPLWSPSSAPALAGHASTPGPPLHCRPACAWWRSVRPGTGSSGTTGCLRRRCAAFCGRPATRRCMAPSWRWESCYGIQVQSSVCVWPGAGSGVTQGCMEQTMLNSLCGLCCTAGALMDVSSRHCCWAAASQWLIACGANLFLTALDRDVDFAM